MSDRELIKFLWKMLKSVLFNDYVPSADEVETALEEVRNREIEVARYLDEIR